MVDVTTYSEARQNLANLMDRVVKNGEPIIVVRKKRGSVVLVSLNEWNSIQETLHLISTRANARALLDAIDQADRGKYAKDMTVTELRRIARSRKPAARQTTSRKTVASKARRGRARIQREAAE